jgi:CPA2 family monovalent cation:H+ antiporter-2
MDLTGFLQELLIILAAGVPVVAFLRRVGVPSIAGLILAGVLIGPEALGLIDDADEVEHLAEVGVVLLLFGIGLELSLDRLRRLWRAVLLGGGVQVTLTVLVTAGIAHSFNLPLPQGIFLGCVVAVSSTAIVLRALAQRGELGAPHGQLALGILVFQDLSVVPMILLVPVLAGDPTGARHPLFAFAVAAVVLAGVLVAAWIVAPRFLDFVSRTRQRDLFVLAVFLVCLGTAWAVSLAGISLALGAFLAGLVVAGSQFRHQALAELIPFREVLSSVFFVSVGMLLDLEQVGGRAMAILTLLLVILVGKFLIVLLTAALLRLPLRVSILTAVTLAQVGEFSFVLFRAAGDTHLLPEPLAGDALAAVILSMLLTPIAIAAGPHLASGAGRVSFVTRQLKVPAPAESAEAKLRDHVIIAGYGLTGRELARALRDCGTPYLVVDLNPDNVRLASAEGEPAYYGDVTMPEVLHELGVAEARELVISVNDPGATERALRRARAMAPKLKIVVRASYAADQARLEGLGASEVIVAEVEAAAELSARVMAARGVDAATIEAQQGRIREDAPEAEAEAQGARPAG